MSCLFCFWDFVLGSVENLVHGNGSFLGGVIGFMLTANAEPGRL